MFSPPEEEDETLSVGEGETLSVGAGEATGVTLHSTLHSIISRKIKIKCVVKIWSPHSPVRTVSIAKMTPSVVAISVISTFAELFPEVIVVESPSFVITTVPTPSVSTPNDSEGKI